MELMKEFLFYEKPTGKKFFPISGSPITVSPCIDVSMFITSPPYGSLPHTKNSRDIIGCFFLTLSTKVGKIGIQVKIFPLIKCRIEVENIRLF